MAESLTLELPGSDPYEVYADERQEPGLWLPGASPLRALRKLPDDVAAVADVDNRALAEQFGHDLVQLDTEPPEPWDEAFLLTGRRRRKGAIGISAHAVTKARRRFVQANLLGYYHRSAVHYTMGASRWDGIAHRLHYARGQYPHWADCSAYQTWATWNAVLPWRLGDFVNGDRWLAGYTGTQTRHGVRVRGHLLPGDLVFYGGSYWVPEHVAGYIGGGMVISHGSEIGPLKLRWNYRPVMQVRRYLRYS